MKFVENPQSPEAAADWAAALALLTSPTAKNSIDGIMGAAGPLLTSSQFVPRTADQPSWYVCRAGDYSVVLVGGCQSNRHGQLTLAGYAGSPTSPTVNPVNPYFEDFATRILRDAGNLGFLTGPNYIFAGYSLGGAVAHILAARTKNTQRGVNVTGISFGAPTTSNHAALAGCNGCVMARWMCEDDPVPLIPPSPSANLSIALLFPVWSILRFTAFTHPWGGMIVSATSHVDTGFLPTLARLNGVTSLAAWLFSQDDASGSPHNILTYQSRLANAAHILGANASHPVKGAGTHEPDPHSRKDARGATRMGLDMLREQEAHQHAVPRAFVPDFGASYVNEGGVFVVSLGSHVIAMTSRERTARSIVRKANASLEAMLLTGVFNREGFVEGVKDFIGQAVKEDGGFSPPLRTELAGGG